MFANSIRSAFLAACCVSSLFVANAKATILTFDVRQANDVSLAANGSLETTYAAYGDGVTSTSQNVGGLNYHYGQGNGFTPNINVSYSKGSAAQLFEVHLEAPGWGSQQIAYPLALSGQNGTANDLYYFNFSPLGASGVKVNSIDLVDFNGTLTYSGTWKVYKDSVLPGNVLSSGSFTTSAGNMVGNPYVINTGSVEYYGDVILEIRRSAGARGNLGFDNVNFDQVDIVPAPEPSSAALLALGALVLVRRVKRQRAA
jgi:hypothetical protein